MSSSAATSSRCPKSDDADWQSLKPVILGVIMEHFVAGHPLLLEEAAQTVDEEDDEADAEIVAQIKELLDTRVRPAVAQEDGGDITYRGFHNGNRDASASGIVSGLPEPRP